MKQHFVVTALASLLIAALPAMSAPANLYAQAVADYNAGKYGQAATEFETIKAQYPNNALTHYYLALCRQALGHLDKAKQEYQWVSQYGDASLKGLANQGMARLSGAKTPAAAGKVRKILEFYADW
jgi:outer membrane protein assembly factor BamD (BamD/ComL family)